MASTLTEWTRALGWRWGRDSRRDLPAPENSTICARCEGDVVEGAADLDGGHSGFHKRYWIEEDEHGNPVPAPRLQEFVGHAQCWLGRLGIADLPGLEREPVAHDTSLEVVGLPGDEWEVVGVGHRDDRLGRLGVSIELEAL